jgi:hypothetical protein
MSGHFRTQCRLIHLAATVTLVSPFCVAATAHTADHARNSLDQTFATRVRPFVEKYCHSCHGLNKQEDKVNLADFTSVDQVAA